MRDQMAKALNWQWENSTRKAQRLCGRVPIAKDGYINLYSHPEKPVISGLMRCSSASCCVVCSSRIALRRGQWLSDIFASARQMGYQISMLTLTVRHKKTDSLLSLINAMENAYTNVQSSKSYVSLRKQYNADFVRVLEITHGSNGWHPHFHIAIIHKAGFDFQLLRDDLQALWIKHIEKQGLKAPLPDKAVNVIEYASNDQRAWYLTKASGLSSLEITNGRVKVSRGDNLGIWQIHGLAVNGSKKHADLWKEYEFAIFGKRIISPSRGMTDKYSVTYVSDQGASMDEFIDHTPVEWIYALDQSLEEDIYNALFDEDSPIIYSKNTLCKPVYIGSITSGSYTQIVKRGLVLDLREELKKESPDIRRWLIENGVPSVFYSPDIVDKKKSDREITSTLADLAYFEGAIDDLDIFLNDLQIAQIGHQVEKFLNSAFVGF